MVPIGMKSASHPVNCDCQCAIQPSRQQNPVARAPAPAYSMVQAGAFIASRQPGTVRGPIETLGVQGVRITTPSMSLSIPKMSFGFPTLELPSLFRSRTNARMQLRESEAPYVGSSYAVPNAVRSPAYSYAAAPAPPPSQAVPAPTAQPVNASPVEPLPLTQLSQPAVPSQVGVYPSATTDDSNALRSQLRQSEDRIEVLRQQLEEMQFLMNQLLHHQPPRIPPCNCDDAGCSCGLGQRPTRLPPPEPISSTGTRRSPRYIPSMPNAQPIIEESKSYVQTASFNNPTLTKSADTMNLLRPIPGQQRSPRLPASGRIEHSGRATVTRF